MRKWEGGEKGTEEEARRVEGRHEEIGGREGGKGRRAGTRLRQCGTSQAATWPVFITSSHRPQESIRPVFVVLVLVLRERISCGSEVMWQRGSV